MDKLKYKKLVALKCTAGFGRSNLIIMCYSRRTLTVMASTSINGDDNTSVETNGSRTGGSDDRSDESAVVS